MGSNETTAADLQRLFEIGERAIKKQRDRFNAAGEWFRSLPEKGREALLSSGVDIEEAYVASLPTSGLRGVLDRT